MIDKRAILAEIQKWGSVPQEEPEDMFIRDIQELPDVSKSRGIRIVKELVETGILTKRCEVMRPSLGRKATAYRLAEGKTLESLAEAIKAIK